jgi:hypothetical protein
MGGLWEDRSCSNIVWWCGLDSSGSEYVPVAGRFQDSKVFSVSMKGQEFIDYPSKLAYQE